MPTKRVDEKYLPEEWRCRSPYHNPPGYIHFEPGLYEHVCDQCGAKFLFEVKKPELEL